MEVGTVKLAPALLAFVTLTANAQGIEPSTAHYAAAYDAIATQRARDQLLAAERRAEEDRRALAALRAQIDARDQNRDRVVDAWAAIVRARAGLPPAALRPGNGYHRVDRER